MSDEFLPRFGEASCGDGNEYQFPDLVGAIYGYHAWSTGWDGVLRGVIFNYPWQPGENTAKCLQADKIGSGTTSNFPVVGYGFDEHGQEQLIKGYQPRACPGIAKNNHGCGFYAYHGTPQGLPNRQARWNQSKVYGVIAMYGQVELGPAGLRSSKAKIVALALSTDMFLEHAELIQQRYDVPIFTYSGSQSNITKMFAAYPISDISNLL